MRLHKEQEAICRSLTTPPGCLEAWGIRRFDPSGHRGPGWGHAAVQGTGGDLPQAPTTPPAAKQPGESGDDPEGTGDLAGAMQLLKEQEAICRRLNNPDGLSKSLGNQA